MIIGNPCSPQHTHSMKEFTKNLAGTLHLEKGYGTGATFAHLDDVASLN